MITEGQVKTGLGRTFLSVVACTPWNNTGDPVSSLPGCGVGLSVLPALQMSSGHFSL